MKGGERRGISFCPFFPPLPLPSGLDNTIWRENSAPAAARLQGRLTVVFLSLCLVLLHDSGCRDRSSRQSGVRWGRREVQIVDSDVVPEHGLSLSIAR